ncbi:MAG: leucine-rich repeat domain-containing protein [Lachnospiraceae bacterium]|nr:leucine-rich repeat domain-containing protein [Lachnospiraceae bacterium]
MDYQNIKKDAKSVKIDNAAKEIPDYAFASFYNIEEINIPDSVEKIGRGAFQNCSKLSKVRLPKNLLELQNNTFFGCRKLENIELPDSLNRIGDQVFFGTGLKEIIIPDKVVTIGNSAFTGVSEFTIRDDFNYTVNKYNIFNWLSEPIYDREADGKIPETYQFIKNVVVTILDNDKKVKFKFLIPFNDKFDFFSISHEIFRDNRLDLGLLDRQFQMIRDFENKTKYVYYRIQYPYKLTDENKNLFERFIVANDVSIAKGFIDGNQVKPLIKLESLGLINSKNIDGLIEYANVNRKFNVLSYLMNYKNEHFGDRYAI